MNDFESTYRETYPKVLAYLRRRASDAVAEDLCADVFTRAWAGWAGRRGEALPWLYGIARHVVSEHYRRRPNETYLPQSADGSTEVPSTSPSVEDIIAGPTQIYAALAQLSPTEREVLQLSAWEGLRTTDIAAALGIGESAARVRLHRARTHLSAILHVDDVSSPSSPQPTQRTRGRGTVDACPAQSPPRTTYTPFPDQSCPHRTTKELP